MRTMFKRSRSTVCRNHQLNPSNLPDAKESVWWTEAIIRARGKILGIKLFERICIDKTWVKSETLTNPSCVNKTVPGQRPFSLKKSVTVLVMPCYYLHIRARFRLKSYLTYWPDQIGISHIYGEIEVCATSYLNCSFLQCSRHSWCASTACISGR